MVYSVKKRRWLWGFCLILTGVFLMGKPAKAAERVTVKEWEKTIVASTTKRIIYVPGRYVSYGSAKWKKAKKISSAASMVKIKRAGFYTMRIYKTNGRIRYTVVKLKKKTYTIAANEASKIKKGIYFIQMKGGAMADVLDGCLAAGTNVRLLKNHKIASSMWEAEKVKGLYIRLKNVGTGQYLTLDDLGNAVAAPLRDGDESFTFRALKAGGKYQYLWNKGREVFLRSRGENLQSGFRKKKKSWKFSFVKASVPSSAAWADAAVTYPEKLNYGKSFSLKGIVRTAYAMEELTAQILDTKGTVVQQKKVYPKRCSYELAGIDKDIVFGRLSPGSYTYRVVVKDCKNQWLVPFSKGFNVVMPATGSNRTLTYNFVLISAVGQQSNGTALEKKACASYALAYCNSILYKTAPSPHTYWSNSTNVDCVWSKGGYATNSYSNTTEVLKAAYDQVAAGIPCILRVSGTTTSQHWVTVIGYKNVTNPDKLTAANFLALDPWNGSLITVSDKYVVKDVYRLAYSTR